MLDPLPYTFTIFSRNQTVEQFILKKKEDIFICVRSGVQKTGVKNLTKIGEHYFNRKQ